MNPTTGSMPSKLMLLPAVVAFTVLSSPLFAADKLEIWPGVSLAGELADNLQQTSATGSDAIGFFGIGATAMMNAPDRRFSLDYSTDAQVYARNSGLDQLFEDQYVGVHDYERLNALTEVSLNDTFINGQSTFGETLIGNSAASPLLSQALLQNSFLTNAFNLEISHEFGERFLSSISVHQTYFSTGNGQTSESFDQGGNLTLYYRLYPRVLVGPEFDLSDFRFSNQPRADSIQPSLRVNFNLSAELIASVRVGPMLLTSPSGSLLEVGYAVSVSYRSPRWLLSLFSSRAPSISGGVSGIAISQYEGISAQYLLSRWTSVYVNSSFYQLSQSADNGYSIAYSAGVTRRLTRSVSIFGTFIRFETNSPGSSNAVTDMLMMGIKFSPQCWILTF